MRPELVNAPRAMIAGTEADVKRWLVLLMREKCSVIVAQLVVHVKQRQRTLAIQLDIIIYTILGWEGTAPSC